MRHFRSIAATSVVLLGGLLATGIPALASTVTYTTTGIFSVGGGTTFSGTGGASLVFASGSGNVTAPSTGTLGSFTTTLPAGGKITGSGTFTLTIDQTSPVVGNANFGSDTLTGSVSVNSHGIPGANTLVITFAQTSVDIGGVVYTLEGLGGGNLAADQLGINITGNDVTTIQADVTTPEPALYSLIGAGFAGMLLVGLRRKQNGVASANFKGGDQSL